LSHLLAPLLAVALLTAPPPGRQEPRPVAAGRYLLQATALLDTDQLPRREEQVEVLALVGPGASARDVRLQLRARGQICDLHARREARGELVLPSGQSCRFSLDVPEARGDFDARLTAGGGTLRDGELALRLRFEVAGRLRAGLELPGAADLAGLAPELPLRGTVEGEGRGREERAP
jgi:hypothetical protein